MMEAITPAYEMAAMVVIAAALFFLPVYGVSCLVAWMVKGRCRLRLFLLFYSLYALWWLVDVGVFYSTGGTSLGHRSFVFYLFSPPADACVDLVHMELDADTATYSTVFRHKYGGRHCIGLGDPVTLRAKVAEPPISACVRFSDLAGKELLTLELHPRRSPFNGEWEPYLTADYSTDFLEKRRSPVRLTVTIRGDLRAFVGRNPGACLFVKRPTVY